MERHTPQSSAIGGTQIFKVPGDAEEQETRMVVGDIIVVEINVVCSATTDNRGVAQGKLMARNELGRAWIDNHERGDSGGVGCTGRRECAGECAVGRDSAAPLTRSRRVARTTMVMNRQSKAISPIRRNEYKQGLVECEHRIYPCQDW